MQLFYTPEFAKTGDVIPFYDEDSKRFVNFYLKNWNPDAPDDVKEFGWHRIITEDNMNYEEKPTGIRGGTGSVLKVDGIYHMFYCTFDFDVDPVAQWVRHATQASVSPEPRSHTRICTVWLSITFTNSVFTRSGNTE